MIIPKLEAGIIASLSASDLKVVKTPFNVQILSIKRVVATNMDRYRLVVSDGEKYMQAMIATQLNDLLASNSLQKNGYIEVGKFVCNNVGGKKILILLQISVLTPHIGDLPKFGMPTSSADPTAPVPSSNGIASNHNPTAPVATVDSPSISNISMQPPVRPAPNAAPNVFSYNSIKSLNPYQNKWTIKARVLSKGEIKTWSNARGEGQLFSCIFTDASGEIRATGFKEAVNTFYELLVEGQVYTISKATIKVANKQWSNVDNDYELTLDSSTAISLCSDQSDVPQIQYKPVSFADLALVEPGTIVDVLAIVKETGPLKKRDLVLADESEYQIKMTLWGKQAESFSEESDIILGMKGAKVSDFSGRSLSSGFDGTIQINPDVTDAHRLRGWWDGKGKISDFKMHANTGPGGAREDTFKSISDVTDENLGMGDKPDYFTLRATISFIKQDNAWYAACPTDECNKKVTEMENGWRCEKCDRQFPAPQYRYILSFSVSDYSGNMWIQGFNDQGEVLLGKTANEMVQLKETNTDEFEAVFANAIHQTMEFKVRAKSEIYQDEPRLRCTATKISKIDWSVASRQLIAAIETFQIK